jgi:hypothetical protein
MPMERLSQKNESYLLSGKPHHSNKWLKHINKHQTIETLIAPLNSRVAKYCALSNKRYRVLAK